MSGAFRAVAVDFDGTLTLGGRPSAGVLDAIADARRRGVRVLLVTGRILTELRECSPMWTRTSMRSSRRTAP